MMALLSTKFDTAMEQFDDLHVEVKEVKNNVNDLEAKIAAGVRDEGIERKKVYHDLESRMVQGFKNEEKGRKIVDEEQEEEEMKMGSICTVGSAACTGYGLV